MIIDPDSCSASEIYGLMIRTVVPRPIAWVSTVSADGVRNLAPFSFFTGISTDPPTVCFAPGRRSPVGGKKDTLINVEATGEFVVNVVTEDLAERMNETATDHLPEIDEFELAGLTPVASDQVLPPRVKESPVNMECKLDRCISIGKDGVGGATLIIGRVVLFHINENVIEAGKVDPDKLRAIGRLGGMDYTRTRDRFTLLRKKP